MSDVTVRLDLETLRALFGGDDPPAVAFKNAIANRFAGEYLKQLVSSKVSQERDKYVVQEIERVLKESVLEDASWIGSAKAKLQSHYRNMIAVVVDKEIETLIKNKLVTAQVTIDTSTLNAKKEITLLRDTTIKSAVDDALSERNIRDVVSRCVSNYIEEFSKHMLRATLDAANKEKDTKGD